MKVFISWSGERSEKMAAALRDWLPKVLQSVQPWMSKSDILPGERWQQVMGTELAECNFGLICLTGENLNSQWINFEAGSLAKVMKESRVIPLLLSMDVTELAGPLTQFQARKAERAGLEDVIRTINNACDFPVPDANVREVFTMFWPQFEAELKAIPTPTGESKPKREAPELLEELVVRVRSMDSRVRTLARRFDDRQQFGVPVEHGVPVEYGVPVSSSRHSRLELEARALELYRDGFSQAQIATELGVRRETLSRIFANLERAGAIARFEPPAVDATKESTETSVEEENGNE